MSQPLDTRNRGGRPPAKEKKSVVHTVKTSTREDAELGDYALVKDAKYPDGYPGVATLLREKGLEAVRAAKAAQTQGGGA